eukprot:CAMPEP_0198660240 /NCGR_PEP_ID=MMETSP1467-20131203/35821_1 /TAXON_ID=1462469 /ORGANISM="unid. sp., Strain CCMP2135" /LENGTH=365 /DNA_ID=CAMNT_0044396641 /DNA_START=22 /DNA_END=1119 /DNA_ORIENTATION=-
MSQSVERGLWGSCLVLAFAKRQDAATAVTCVVGAMTLRGRRDFGLVLGVGAAFVLANRGRDRGALVLAGLAVAPPLLRALVSEEEDEACVRKGRRRAVDDSAQFEETKQQQTNGAKKEQRRRRPPLQVCATVCGVAAPLSAYATLARRDSRGWDDRVVATAAWAAIAFRFGYAQFLLRAWPHDVHALVVCGAVLLSPPLSSAVILSFSFGYFFVDLATCLLARDVMYAAHAAVAVVLIAACLEETNPAIHAVGARVLLIEASTPLMHAWQRRPSRRNFALFVATFFLARCVFLPWHTRRILALVLSTAGASAYSRSLVLLPLNLLQFVWFLKLLSMFLAYDSNRALALAQSSVTSSSESESSSSR